MGAIHTITRDDMRLAIERKIEEENTSRCAARAGEPGLQRREHTLHSPRGRQVDGSSFIVLRPKAGVQVFSPTRVRRCRDRAGCS